MKTLKISTFLTICMLAFVMASCGNNKKDESTNGKEAAEEANEEKFETKDSEKRADFFVDAIAANMTELQLAELAVEKSSNSEIKKMAAQLVKDHTVILNDLKALAGERGVTYPTEITSDDAKDVQSLREEKAVDFDKKWLKEMEDRHESSIKKFEKCGDDSSDAALQALANKHLPTIRSHHQMVENMLAKY